MSTALRSDEYLVITSIGGRTRSRVWDARKPLALGHPMRWVLERTQDGSFCVRDIGGGLGEVSTDAVRRFGPRELASRTAVSLPNAHSRNGKASSIQATLLLEAVRPIAPPHTQLDPKTLSDPQTFVFAGVRKTVISSAAVQAGYAGYAGTRAAFTINPTPAGFKLKPLMDHLTLTPIKGTPVQLIRKDSINLTKEEVLNSTVTHGQYWWKFGLVSNPALVPGTVEHPFIQEDNSRFKKAASAALSIWLLFLLLMWMMPAEPKEDKPPEEAPLVKIEPPKRDAITQQPQKKPDLSETPAAAAAPAPEKAPEPEKQPPAKKVEEPKPEPPKAEDKAPEKKAEPAKPAANKAGALNAKELAKPAAHKATAKAVNKAPVVVESAAEIAAKARTKMLKDLLGGAAHGLANDHKLESMAGKASTKSAASALGDLGTADGAMAAPTEVKPGFAGSSVKVGSLGGKDAGGSKDGSAVGYATGEHASVQGQGGSFVSMSSNGASVEEGLTKEEVGAVIHSHLGEIRYCHEASMLANPTIQGKLVLQFTITAQGVVDSVSVASTTIPDAKLPECVVGKLKNWRFPRPKNGVKVSVAYPFLFKTLGRE